MGHNYKQNLHQSIFDNFEMGKAYYANAVIILYSLIYSKNYCNISDSLIFPVLFDIWHSIELLLKSGIQALTITSHNQAPKGHDIFKLKIDFEEDLRKHMMYSTIENELIALNILMSEFKKVGAKFDFARYSFDMRGDFQFYNAPSNDLNQWQNNGKDVENSSVPNTCVDLLVLFELLHKITISFLQLIQYLTICISESESPSDKGYENFKKIESTLDNDITTSQDPIIKILNAIYFDIL